MLSTMLQREIRKKERAETMVQELSAVLSKLPVDASARKTVELNLQRARMRVVEAESGIQVYTDLLEAEQKKK